MRVSNRRLLPVVLGVHLVVATAHGLTHGLVPVPLPDWATLLVLGTTFVGPVAGVVLDRRGHRAGLTLFTASMAAAFLLGVLLHFVLENPDHVHALPADRWRREFRVTALAVGVTPAVGTLAVVWLGWTR